MLTLVKPLNTPVIMFFPFEGETLVKPFENFRVSPGETFSSDSNRLNFTYFSANRVNLSETLVNLSETLVNLSETLVNLTHRPCSTVYSHL